MNYYRKESKPIMSLPLVSLNQMLFLSGLAFATGVLLTVGILGHL